MSVAADTPFPTMPERAARCRHFGACGGCQLQHLSQMTQLAGKVQSVAERLALASVAIPPIQTHTAKEYEYRNRIRMRVQHGHVGYSRRASNDFLPIVECPISAPLLWRAAATLQEIAGWPDRTTEIELFTDAAETSLQLLLHVDATVATLDRDSPQRLRTLCSQLQTHIPQLAGAGLLVQGELAVGSRRVQERQRVEVARWGSPGLTYKVNGTEYAVSRGAFFQVNRFLTGRMVDLVLGDHTGDTAWDLFAGAGLFSLPLTQRFVRVTAVEVGQPAANDLLAALRARGPNRRAVAQPVAAFLAKQTNAADLIVMDPPRAGLGRDVVQHLLRLNAPVLVYVSCDATTFARDARALVDSRYAVTELHLLDLFPQTTHTETIAVFRQR